MVHEVQNNHTARFMPWACGAPTREPEGQAVLRIVLARADVVRRSTCDVT